ncbi:MAG: hypothetical protein BWK76_23720 [Desulfobulbaceae bacterium A2]|nr:MAG: hypothetical protein BWK76_23720 [Desulfobulbaceae bacterium A2]
MRPWRCLFSLVFLLALLLLPEHAWALQSHGPPEGFYVHQMAHVLYAVSLLYLARDVRRSALSGQGWRHLRTFCFLMTSWNIVALVGHFAERSLDASALATINGYLSLHLVAPIDWLDMLFYLAKLDHLISVPAIFFLLLVLRAFHQQLDARNDSEPLA